jgi:Zn-dependent oligopeptidase
LWLSSENFKKNNVMTDTEIEISNLENKFMKNIDNFNKFINHNTFHTKSEKFLEGLSPQLKNKAKNLAIKKNKDGFLFYLNDDFTYSLLSQLKNRVLRQRIYLKFNDLTKNSKQLSENLKILKKVYLLKNKLAKEKGYTNYKDLVLSNYLLDNEKTTKYLDILENKNEKQLELVYDEILNLFEKDGYNKDDFQPFDLLFYINKFKNSFYDKKLKNYFPIEQTIYKSLKEIGNIFDLTFKKISQDENNIYYKITDNLAEREGVLKINIGSSSSVYEIDFSTINSTSSGNIPQVSLINLGLEKNTQYLSFYNLKNFFHEMGHFLHSFFSYNINNCIVNVVNGYKLSWDLIETPSQLLENLIFNKDFVSKISSNNNEDFKIQYENTLSKFFKLSSFYLQENIIMNKTILNLYENVKTNKKISSINNILKNNNIFYLAGLDSSHLNYNYKTDYIINSSHVYLFSEQLACQLINKYKVSEFRYIYENIFNNNLDDANQLIKKETNVNKIDLKNFVHSKNLKF